MALKDEIRKERQSVKQGTWEKKLQYFKDYYMGRTVIAVIVAVLVVYAIVSVILGKKIVLSGVMLNSPMTASEEAFTELTGDFINDQRLESDKVEFELIRNLSYTVGDSTKKQENYATIQVLSAKISGGLLDFVIGDLDSVSMFAYSECFTDLRKVLSEEQIAMYEPFFLYIDLAVIEQLADIAASENYDVEIEAPDHTKPEQMEQPVPVFIDVTGCARLQSIYPNEEKLVLSVAANAPDLEMLMQFIAFLMTEE